MGAKTKYLIEKHPLRMHTGLVSWATPAAAGFSPRQESRRFRPCLPVGEEKYAQLGMVRSQLASVGPDSAQLQELRAVVAACRHEARHGRTEGEA